MFWDNIAGVYDLFEKVYNPKVYSALGKRIALEIDKGDTVLECACGTGSISKYIAPECRLLIAADISKGMLRQAEKNCKGLDNIRFKYADIMALGCSDNSFDKVVAGNVIHLLDRPEAALSELMRVCKPGGRVIVPTYINDINEKQKAAAKLIDLAGADLKRQFDIKSYREFFEALGYENVRYDLVEGKMCCMIAIIEKSD